MAASSSQGTTALHIPTVTTLDLPGIHRVASGKVREIFDLGDSFLFVATDRVSAYDVILPNGIPHKGRVLTQLSRYWFAYLGVANHLISCDLADLPPDLTDYHERLAGRFMIVRKLEMIPVECVVRGYLVGSGYKDYQQTGAVSGIFLPAGLNNAQQLAEPIFTPASKVQDGHDENISFATMCEMLGDNLARSLRTASLDIYSRAARRALERGIIMADTKFEFGLLNGQIVLADEVLTPDSSRYWPVDAYSVGQNPPSYDKQYVRDYLTQSGWNKQSPGPVLPDSIVTGTTRRYLECYERIVGEPLNGS